MIKKNSFKYEELIDCGNGKLFGPGNAKLPLPPMLMFDRITNIQDLKGKYNKGMIEAELDIKDNNISVHNLPKTPKGKKIKSIEVLVKIEDTN